MISISQLLILIENRPFFSHKIDPFSACDVLPEVALFKSLEIVYVIIGNQLWEM
jgi:hypothetical protein